MDSCIPVDVGVDSYQREQSVRKIWCKMSPTAALAAVGIAVLLLSAPVVVVASDSQVVVSEVVSQRDTTTTLYAASTYFKCTSNVQITATSTQDVIDIIKTHTARSKATNKTLKIRATRHGLHSSAGFACAGERGSSKLEIDADAKLKSRDPSEDEKSTSISLLLHQMNQVVSVDAEQYKLTVEAGMTLQSMVDAAEAHNMSVTAGALSMYANLTVGGVISASAHGSGSFLGALVRKLKWINARGDVIVSDGETEAGAKEVAAILGGIGLLGVITEVTLQLEPSSRTVVEIRHDLDDGNIVAELKNIMNLETPSVMCYWRPDLGTYRVALYTHVPFGDALPATAPALDPNAINVDLVGVSDEVASAVSKMTAAWGNDLTDESDSADFSNAAACGAAEAQSRSPTIRDGDGLATKHATLPTNRAMLTPECAPNCFWDPHHTGVVIEAGEFAIKLSQLEAWVQDVKAIVRTELAEIEARLRKRFGEGEVKSCLSGPFVVRFGRETATLLSTSTGTGTEGVAYVQWLPLQSALTPRKPGKDASVWDTVEQLTLCKYRGRPSWGQNHERIFRHPRCHVRDHFPASNFDQMLALQQHHDPDKIFEPKLFSHVLRRSGPDYSNLCKLQNCCYCEEDAHCPHSHSCQPSAAFPEYKICKVIVDSALNMQHHDEL